MIRDADDIRARLQSLPLQPINDWPRTTRVQAQWEPIALRDLPHGNIWVVAAYTKMRPNGPTVCGEIVVDGIRRRPTTRTQPATLQRTIALNSRGEWIEAITNWQQINLDPRADYGAWHNTAFAPCAGFETLKQQYVVTVPGFKRDRPYLAEITYHTVA